ncbi:hypothetical protein F441_03180 [Phytophthora nicotianae CJ01A1]|nr:hypothetical protein F441_03180 [Phytophthora nicotianae CJ01A1]
MASWDSLANKLKTLKDFSKKDTISGKSAQARFNTLVASHRKFGRKSEGAWGIDQRYAEKRQLLDDLVSQFDEHERDEGRCIRERKDKLAAEENAGKVMRDAGLKRMKERKKKARTKLMRTKVLSVTSPASLTWCAKICRLTEKRKPSSGKQTMQTSTSSGKKKERIPNRA